MLRYQSSRWFEILTHFYRSAVLRRILEADLLVGAYAAGVVYLTQAGHLPSFKVSAVAFPVMTLLLSFLLGFRTNTAYDRWWEGRKLWGALVNVTRNLALFLSAQLPVDAEDERAAFAAEISSFVAALNHFLRRDLDLAKLPDLSDEDRETLAKVEHAPLALAGRLASRIEKLHIAGQISDIHLLDLRTRLGQFMDISGACERIKNTPIPFSYSSYMKNLVLWFCLLMPFGIQADNGYWTVPLVMLTFGCLVGLELLAADIEDPFGYDENDLPLGRLTHMIRRNVHEVLLGTHPPGETIPPLDPTGIQRAL